jgi:hypothetical protein
LPKSRIVPDGIEIVVLAHVTEVAVAQFDGAAEGLEGAVGFFQESEAAGEVVVSQRVVRAEFDEAFVDLQPLGIAALEREVVAVDAKNVNIVGVTFEDAAEEVDLEVDLALVGRPGGGAGCEVFAAFVRVFALVSHVHLPCTCRDETSAGQEVPVKNPT